MAFVVISILFGMILTSIVLLIGLELSSRRVLRGLVGKKPRAEVPQKKVQAIREGQGGEVGIVIQNVRNPEITQSFIKKFNEAYEETAGYIDFHSGELRLWFKIENVAMSKELADELEKAGFYVGINREGL